MPFPATNGFTSKFPTTTFFIPLLIIKSAHGGVFPKWEQGSKLTYNVDFFSKASFIFLIAFGSACSFPYAE